MLVSKKVIHLTKFIKKEYKKHFTKELVYTIAKPRLFALSLKSLFDFKYLCYNTTELRYSYKIKLSTPSSAALNVSLMRVVTLLKFINFIFKIKFNFLISKSRSYTLLRSPFVNKKSREQLEKTTKVGLINLKVDIKNIFFLEYLEYFFNTKFLNSDSVKIFITKTTRF